MPSSRTRRSGRSLERRGLQDIAAEVPSRAEGPLLRLLSAIEAHLPESLDQIELVYSREESTQGTKWTLSFKTKSLIFAGIVAALAAVWCFR